ncbi:hypothetical protein HPHPP26_1617 [Helicobacter pylori Hp P-26]|nr:hypothetical protein HPHPP26_1617 [Helicobacter pylori Hp P-26]
MIKNYRFKKLWSASKFLYLEKQPKIFIKCCQILRLTPKNAFNGESDQTLKAFRVSVV